MSQTSSISMDQRSEEEIKRSNAASVMGSKGGQETYRRHGRDHFVAIGKKSVTARVEKRERQKTQSDALPQEVR